tara:strand:- start:3975 stop:4535 length:561 start_codon:yes stop_codon:yes gene_type:complete
MEYFSKNFEDDCLSMFLYLEQLPLFTSTNRAKYGENGKGVISNVYGTTHFSHTKTTKGKTWRMPSPDGKGYYTKLRKNHPEFADIFKEFVDLYGEEFKFNQVVINRDFKITRHIDNSNVGESIIMAFGDYEGGEICLEREGSIETHSIKHKFLKFNGSKIYHYVKDFTGTRYSLVFYNTDIKAKKN